MLDDYPLIVNNERIRSFDTLIKSSTGQFFTETEHPYLHYWRPVILFSYYIDYKIWKLRSGGYHLSNIIFHTINVILIFLILQALFDNLSFSFLSSAIFSILPSHVENVFWISGRTDLIATLFILLSSLFFINYFKEKRIGFFYLSLLSFIFALLSKEISVLFPFILVLYLILKRLNLKEILKVSLPFYFFEGIYILLHFHLSHSNSVLKRVSLSDIFDSIKAFGTYFKIMFFPFFKSYYISMKKFDISQNEYLFSIAFFILIIGVYFFRNQLKKSFYALPLLSFLIPVLNLNIILSYPLICMRFVYLPSIFSAILFAELLILLYKKERKYVVILFIIFSLFIFYYFKYQPAFKGSDKNIEILSKLYPDEDNLKLQLAYIFAKKGYYKKALELTDKALELSNSNRWINIKADATLFKANLLILLKRDEEAKALIIETLKKYNKPKTKYYGYLLLSKYYERKSEYKTAIDYLKKAKDISETSDVLFRLALIHYYKKDYKNAFKYLEKAKKIDPMLKDYEKLKELILRGLKE